MTIPLTGSQSLFDRLGAEGRECFSINKILGSGNLTAGGVISCGASTDSIAAQYASTDQPLIFAPPGLYSSRDQFRNACRARIGYLSALSTSTVVQMVDDDGPLSQANIQTALPILISQMTAASQTVQANATTVTVTVGGSNVGSAVFTASIVRSDGRLSEYVLRETISVTCIADAQSGGSGVAGSETFSAVGEIAVSDLFAFNWPAGSGVSRTITLSDPNVVGILTNGSFETWTVSNVPDGWTIATGTAGTTVFKEASNILRGSAALKITGNGSELTSLTQSMALAASSVYAVNMWIKMSAVPTGGVLQVDLYNGSAIVQDAAGTNNAVTKSLSSATTSYKPLNTFFRTPAVMPATITCRVHLTTALDNAKSLYIDDLCIVPVTTQFYTGGPYITGFPGATNVIKNDSYSIVTTNDLGGSFQTYVWQSFNMPSLGLQLPSAVSSPTIPESLIV